jgi:hypothetical protein
MRFVSRTAGALCAWLAFVAAWPKVAIQLGPLRC